MEIKVSAVGSEAVIDVVDRPLICHRFVAKCEGPREAAIVAFLVRAHFDSRMSAAAAFVLSFGCMLIGFLIGLL